MASFGGVDFPGPLPEGKGSYHSSGDIHEYGKWSPIQIVEQVGDVLVWKGHGPAWIVVKDPYNLQFYDISRVDGPDYIKAGGWW